MSEITKLYENAGIEKCNSTFKDIIPNICLKECEEETYKCKDCEHFEYPPFTAAKQLELLKICFDKYERLEKVRGLKERCIIYHHFEKDYTEFVNCETWEETIAGLINNLWQSLTSEEKQQVKGILE